MSRVGLLLFKVHITKMQVVVVGLVCAGPSAAAYCEADK